MRISDWSSDVCSSDLVAGRTHPYLRTIVAGPNDSYVVWYWYRIAGQSTNSRFLGKLLEVKAAMIDGDRSAAVIAIARSEEHTSELQSLMRISYVVFCLKKKKQQTDNYFPNSTLKEMTPIIRDDDDLSHNQ